MRKENENKPAWITAFLCGEMNADDIPPAPGVDVAELKGDDPDPLDVVFAVPAGKSTRGWNYKPEALMDIVNHVNSKTLNGHRGHRKEENMGTEFPPIVAHWVGAKMIGNIAYFRAIMDKSDPDLKRWVRRKRIKQVSIFGYPKLLMNKGEIDVVGYRPKSIDFAPLDQSGMPTYPVAMGEMDTIGELDGSHEELREALQAAVRQLLTPEANTGYVWIRRIWDDHLIAEHEHEGTVKLYKFPYSANGETVVLGEKIEVVKKEDYIPIENSGEIESEGGTNVDFNELIEKIKSMITAGTITRQNFMQAVGEMGFSVYEVSGEMAGKNPALILDKVKEALGVTGEMDVVMLAGEAKEALNLKRKNEFNDRMQAVLAEKVAGEMAQSIVRDMINLPVTATKEQIAGEIDQILARESVKNILSQHHFDTPVGGGNVGAKNNYLQTKRVSI